MRYKITSEVGPYCNLQYNEICDSLAEVESTLKAFRIGAKMVNPAIHNYTIIEVDDKTTLYKLYIKKDMCYNFKVIELN